MASNGKSIITTSRAFIIIVSLIALGFVYTGFKPAAHYITFVGALTAVFTGVAGKRLMQKKDAFIGK